MLVFKTITAAVATAAAAAVTAAHCTAYLMQYVPQLGLAVMQYIGPKRARALSRGQSGYDLSAMMKAGSS
jgi:hypothetical protein